MEIYKIFRPDEWRALEGAGETRGAPVDLADGYIHFSTAAQVPQTLARHFAREAGTELCACDTDDLGEALRWEPSRGGALFPHLYRPLRLGEVRWHQSLPLVDGRHRLPPRLG